ncbi:hypothetical protein LAZ67_19001077 [Cordylochernes scorpioides]|uniref:Ribosomal protein S10 n=1 Tax=Cordylochernes scorpioides TaxID=51811 RepID=A0ABY6LKA0_9ARAC|nr:hypothetical protein LAZ67_19001077 [Cordylochernes scorpioides]
MNENLPIQQKIQKILLRYRATPLANGKSPAEMYLNRQIQIKFVVMLPYQEEKSQQLIQPRTRCLQVGEHVQTKFTINNKPLGNLQNFINSLSWRNGDLLRAPYRSTSEIGNGKEKGHIR